MTISFKISDNTKEKMIESLAEWHKVRYNKNVNSRLSSFGFLGGYIW